MWDPTAPNDTGNHPTTSQNTGNVNIHGGNFSATGYAPQRRSANTSNTNRDSCEPHLVD